MEQKQTHEIKIIGIGPGDAAMMTEEAKRALECSEVIVGYPVYLSLLQEQWGDKEFLSTPMKQEEARCRMCFEEAQKGRKVALVCSGDAGIYGLASLMYTLLPQYPDCSLSVVAGVTAASSGAALLGAPLNHDFCVISLSDLLTSWEQIEKRLRAAAEGDFAIALYNPSSRKRADYLKRACTVLLEAGVEKERACGYVENIGRAGTKTHTCTLEELADTPVNMFTTVFIGNSTTVRAGEILITKRGYMI